MLLRSPRRRPGLCGVGAEPLFSNEGHERPGSAPGPIGAGDPVQRSLASPPSSKLESGGQSGKPRLLGPESIPDVPLLAVAMFGVSSSDTRGIELANAQFRAASPKRGFGLPSTNLPSTVRSGSHQRVGQNKS